MINDTRLIVALDHPFLIDAIDQFADELRSEQRAAILRAECRTSTIPVVDQSRYVGGRDTARRHDRRRYRRDGASRSLQ
jgi:hypothetical protein